MIHRNSTVFIAVLIMFLTSTASFADSASQRGQNRERIEPSGFLYGGAIGIQREIYTGFDRRVIPLPIVGYRGEKLIVFGPFVSYEVLKSGDFKFSAQFNPRFQGFDESDSEIFAGMKERKFSMDLGLGLNYERNNWKFELAGLHDVLGRSNGTEFTTSLGKVFRVGSVFVEPEMGLSFLDNKHVDYYYGVDQSEATNFRPAFEGEDALNYTLAVSLVTPAFFDGLTRLSLENTWFDSSISDSPLTDTDTSLSFLILFSKFF